jgi:hypothetical protein
LPLLARRYVWEKDLAGIDPWHRPVFRTKLVRLSGYRRCPPGMHP